MPDIGQTPSWVLSMKRQLRSGVFSDPHIAKSMDLTEDGSPPVEIIKFVVTRRDLYMGEVGRKGSDVIFHFFPVDLDYTAVLPKSTYSGMPFEDVMADAFIEVFRHQDKISAVYTEELRSWAVKVRGYSDNAALDELCNKLFDALDRRMKL